MGDQYKSYGLISAVQEGKLERVREIISSVGLSYLQGWSEGYVLLCHAIENKQRDVAKILLSYNFEVNSNKREHKERNTPLHCAVINGDIEIVNMLLDRGARIDEENLFEISPLHSAVKRKMVEIIELLLSRGANVDAKGRREGTALHVASREGNLQIVECLLNHGANINSMHMVLTGGQLIGYTPLHVAVQGGCKEVIKLLLSRGANVDAKARDGVTALHIASQRGSIEIVEHLLNHGANINCALASTIKEGYTPLHLAVDENNLGITKLLLSRSANVDAKGRDGKTALHIASERGFVGNIDHLLNHGANINCALASTIREGYTPLLLAVDKHQNFTIEFLLSRGANINAEGKDGKTALHIAVEKGNIEIVEHFLNHRANINCALVSLFREDGSFQMQSFPTSYGYSIAWILKCHMIKMKTANFYISEKHFSIICNALRTYRHEIFRNKCEKEIASMKNEKFNNANVSFHDILANGDNINQLAMYARNENIVRALRSNKYKIKFPLYAGMINSNIIKGETRRELLEQSNKIFYFFFNNFGLLQECTEKIFSYLSNEDLRILIDTY